MKSEFIKNYEEEERESVEKFYNSAIAGDFSLCRRYFTSRFSKLNSPVSFLLSTVSHPNSVWSVVPLAGTTLLTLLPSPRANFESEHGFAVDDIPNLVDYVKKEGFNFYLETFLLPINIWTSLNQSSRS